MATLGSRIMSAWNAFTNRSPNELAPEDYSPARIDYGMSSGYRPDRTRLRIASERSIISSIYTRLSIDVAQISIRHVQLDDDNRYLEDRDSGLNECLTVEANLDQDGRALRQDIAMTLFDKGCAAVVPVDTTLDPTQTGGYDIRTLRVGEVIQWYPQHVRLSLYNEATGRRQEITLAKSFVAIVENPLYSVMNGPNSTLQRLIRKLTLLDTVDDNAASGKLDLIVQLPYVVKTETRRAQAMQRRDDIEFQLRGSKYGVAYTDGTEKVIQLNRPVENNLLAQIKDLKEQLYTELGVTPEVMNGTADEATMLNYKNRTLEPILDSIVGAMKRKFLTKTARTQGQSVEYFIDAFKLVPVSNISEIGDKMIRNQIMTANEFRQILGLKPSGDPRSDQLNNPNMPNKDTGFDNPADQGAPPVDPAQEAAAAADETNLDQQMAELGIQ